MLKGDTEEQCIVELEYRNVEEPHNDWSQKLNASLLTWGRRSDLGQSCGYAIGCCLLITMKKFFLENCKDYSWEESIGGGKSNLEMIKSLNIIF